MNDHRPSSIEEAPTLDDIKDAGDRVGKVDFTSRLGDRMDPEQQPAEDDAEAALKHMVRPQRPAGTDEDEDAAKMPFILPPASVDEAMRAETEATKAEVAAARGELPDDEDDTDDTDDVIADDDADDASTDAIDDVDAEAHDDEGDESSERRTGLLGKRGRKGKGRKQPAERSEEVDGSDDAEPVRSGPPEGLVIQSVADIDGVGAEAARVETVDSASRDAAEAARLEAEAEAEAEDAIAFEAEIDAAIAREEAMAADDPHRAPLRSVAEVAAAVIESMHRINEAHERHVESLELETARRCELLTAQAELDAELIRLHARREAHAIISAARLRVGEPDPDLVETDQLGEIGETFSRFAETIETAVATRPESPDHLRKS